MKKFIATISLLFSLTLACSSAHAANTVPGCPVGYNCIPIVQTAAPVVCPTGYRCIPNSNSTGSQASNTNTYVPGSFYNSYLSNLGSNTANTNPNQNAGQYTNATNTSSGANLGASQNSNVASTTIPLQPSLASPDLTGCSRINGSSTPLTTDFTSDGILIPAIHGSFTMNYSIPIECLLTNLGIDESMRDNNIRMGLFMEPGSNTGQKVLDVKIISFAGGVNSVKKYFSSQALSSCSLSNLSNTPESLAIWLFCLMRTDGYRPADLQETTSLLNYYPVFALNIKTKKIPVGALGSMVQTASPSKNNEANGDNRTYTTFFPSIGASHIVTSALPISNFLYNYPAYIVLIKDTISPIFVAEQIDLLPTDKAKGSNNFYVNFTPDQYLVNVDYSSANSSYIDDSIRNSLPQGQKDVTVRFLKINTTVLDPITHQLSMINSNSIKGTIDNYAEEHGYRSAISSEVEALFNQYPNIVVPTGGLTGSGTLPGKEFIEGLGQTNSCGGFPMIYNPFGKAVYYCCVRYLNLAYGGIYFGAAYWKFAVVKI